MMLQGGILKKVKFFRLGDDSECVQTVREAPSLPKRPVHLRCLYAGPWLVVSDLS